jgi:periplasmic divalent cation tolerance protein
MLAGAGTGVCVSEPILLVLTTCDAATAATLAESLVEQRLAACVNALEGVASTYRWQGRIERGTETMLVIKTTPQRYPALEAHIRSHSGYELPEIVAVRSDGGLAAYLDWVHAETKAG